MKGKIKLGKIAIIIIIGIALMLEGGYQIYEGLGGNKQKANDVAQSNVVVIGETITDKNGVDFCVTSVDNATSIGEDCLKVTTDNNYIIVSVKIINNGNEAYDVNVLRFTLTENNKEYETCPDTLGAVNNYMYLDTLNPGLSKEYVIAYETSFKSEDKECQLKISNNAFTNDDFVYINLH